MSETKLDGECWIKKRPIASRPFITIRGRRFLASRVVLAIHDGLDVEDLDALVCHICENKQCYNPDHLYIGDKSSNAKDAL